jgi:acyl-CoA dehydrogenase
MDNLTIAALVLAALVALLTVRPLRRVVISKPLMKMAGGMLPTIGETERIALEAGTVWWDGELFSGAPKWKKLTGFNVRKLSKDEQAFIDGPVNKLCEMLDDFELAQERMLPPQVWNFIKKNKFFGMIIPKEHGGLGFSAAAHSAVVAKIASRSVATAVTVMVPNSLGPGELLLRYGTEAQKKYYLPRLAKGDEIPCFALTEPTAGSDAANGKSHGVMTRGRWQGKEVVGIKLNFAKRYITLAPVATVVGLAFKLSDPDGLLGGEKDIGITCALLPHDIAGMTIGNQHDPMGVPFPNGPIFGKDVFIPLEFVIGGREFVGQGWRMLMEALAAGRGISLPSLSVGAAQVSTRATSAYAVVREQFGMQIGKFEGVRERLARIAAHSYFMEATRRLTAGAVDAGEHPAVASAVAKAYLTEGMRLTLNDGMDIMAGASICRGPGNIFSRAYMSIPIGITVEGSNILTRSLIVFGQGAIRCHPYLQAEVDALAARDLKKFDRALFGHIGHIIANALRAKFHAVTGGMFSMRPMRGGMGYYYRKLNRFSAAFALLADFGLVTMGGALKRKEYLSGRYADALAWMYIASATLKRMHDSGYPASEKPLVEWVMAHAFHEIEKALLGVTQNLPNRFMATLGRLIVFPLGAHHYHEPTDRMHDKVVDALLNPDGVVREALTGIIYRPEANSPGLGVLDDARSKVLATEAARKKMSVAIKRGLLPKRADLNAALKAGIISAAEKTALVAAEKAVDAAIQVAHYAPKVYKTLK